MDLIRKSIFKFTLLILVVHLNTTIAQHNLVGNWSPQHTSESCWAATLANLTKVNWVKDSISEKQWIGGILMPVDIDYFEGKIDSVFKHRSVLKGNVLSYKAINNYLKYPFGRPLIYNYFYENSTEGDGHFVNIIGCDTSKNLSSHNKYWLKIYDPKPDGIGSTYFKNYESYRVTSKVVRNLASTFYTIVRVEQRPSQFPDDIYKAIQEEKYACDSCLSDIKNSQASIKKILQDSLFSQFLGKKIEFPKNWNFEMIKIDDIVSDEENNLKTVENTDVSIFIVNNDEHNSLKGGTILKFMPKSKKYLIERIEDISRYEDIKKYLLKENKPQIVIVKNQFRFIRFKRKNSNYQYVDMDNLFKSANKKPIPYSVFKQKILTHYLKVSEGGRQIIEAFQKLITRADSTCSFGQNENTTFCRNSVVLEKYLFPTTFDSTKKIPRLVPFIASYYPSRIGSERHNLVFHIQSYATYQIEYNPCPTCYPKTTIYYPYTSTDANLDVLLIKIADYQLLEKIDYTSSRDNWFKYVDKAILTNTIKQIGNPRLESFTGYMNTNIGEKKLPNNNNYASKMSAKGIICDVLLNDGNIVKCYLLCNHDSDERFQWKE